MRRLNQRAPRIAGLFALALGAVAFLALSGVAAAKDHGDDHGHGRHHHHRFLQEAGKISSFDATTGKLTIALPDGETVTGLVTDESRIRCEGNDDRRFDRRDNSGHGNEPGDDNGGRNEPGDDRGGDNSGPGSSGSNGTSGGPGPSGEGNEGEPGEASCTVASLVPGAVVGEAELRLEGGGAVFTEIELGQDS